MTAIRIPVEVVEQLNKIGRAERRLAVELGRAPTTTEVAGAAGIAPADVVSLKRRVAPLTEP